MLVPLPPPLMNPQVLLEQSDSGLELQDRWGNTPMDDAKLSGAQPVVLYLQTAMSERSEAKHGHQMLAQQRCPLEASSDLSPTLLPMSAHASEDGRGSAPSLPPSHSGEGSAVTPGHGGVA